MTIRYLCVKGVYSDIYVASLANFFYNLLPSRDGPKLRAHYVITKFINRISLYCIVILHSMNP